MGQELLNENSDTKDMVNGGDERILLNSGNGSILEEERTSYSSLSSDSSAEENAEELGKPIAGDENIHRSNSKIPPDSEIVVSLPSEVVTRDSEMSTPNSSSPRFDARNLDDSAPAGVKESPPEQVMVRPDVPDPYRIPSTVFDSRSATPMNWSVASNESLFSIHVGNSSFSRDHVFLGRSGDLSNFPGSPLNPYPPTPPVVDPDAKRLETENGLEKAVTTERANVDAMTDGTSASSDGHIDREKPSAGNDRHSTSTSRYSDASTHSFAFPILAERSGSRKVESENQPQEQLKAADQKEDPEQVFDAAATKWFPFCPCSFCC